MQKTYILDGSVLLHAPYALESFEENHIVLPLAVLEELDSLQGADSEQGRNARQVIRFLEQIRLQGNLLDGVQLSCGGTLRIEVNHVHTELPHGMNPEQQVSRILRVCKGLSEDGIPVILVSRDIVTRIKAQMMGILAEEFTTDQIPKETTPYTGRADVYVPNDQLSGFKKKGISAQKLYTLDQQEDQSPTELTENQFLILHPDADPQKTLLGRYHAGRVTALEYSNAKPFGVKPRNVGQRFMQEALMMSAKEAPLVIIKGPAGTAKTFYTLAVGLEKVMEQETRQFRKILVCRPNAQFDQDIGFLPGSEKEKISPLMRPIVDNLEILLDLEHKKEHRSSEEELHSQIDYLLETGIITVEAMNFMRGRSITDTLLMIDEAQNLTPRQVKGIVTRVGQGTKVVLLGDPAQIDHPLLDERSNGLSYASERMKGSPLCVQLTMQADECERSDLALDAAMRM